MIGTSTMNTAAKGIKTKLNLGLASLDHLAARKSFAIRFIPGKYRKIPTWHEKQPVSPTPSSRKLPPIPAPTPIPAL